eukprot:CAMPEP_0115355292 /NCGR_PEP_ID=MMETSP0270-20121206/99030_1 /TAXON_ID=71861 /ORGANISM="Scrippsiella trochoidea, Strain CCMP3099" /LENGTH=168 /DNA_ID=CAMNT_0002777659 /DNA_START=9 /DNA_END=511 /DNA_ORIENTATION=+
MAELTSWKERNETSIQDVEERMQRFATLANQLADCQAKRFQTKQDLETSIQERDALRQERDTLSRRLSGAENERRRIEEKMQFLLDSIQTKKQLETTYEAWEKALSENLRQQQHIDGTELAANSEKARTKADVGYDSLAASASSLPRGKVLVQYKVRKSKILPAEDVG